MFADHEKKFTDYETTVVRIAKVWDSPHAGTVPILLGSTFKLAPMGLGLFLPL